MKRPLNGQYLYFFEILDCLVKAAIDNIRIVATVTNHVVAACTAIDHIIGGVAVDELRLITVTVIFSMCSASM